MKYEMVAGFETHIELGTKTKIFCGCSTEFGGAPNSPLLSDLYRIAGNFAETES